MQARRSMAASAKPWSIPTHHSNHKLYGLTAHYESPPLVSYETAGPLPTALAGRLYVRSWRSEIPAPRAVPCGAPPSTGLDWMRTWGTERAGE